jgi:hypothetical protein
MRISTYYPECFKEIGKVGHHYKCKGCKFIEECVYHYVNHS